MKKHIGHSPADEQHKAYSALVPWESTDLVASSLGNLPMKGQVTLLRRI